MRTAFGIGRLDSVLSLEEREDDGEDKAWIAGFGISAAARRAGRWTVARDALWIERVVVDGRVSHRAGGPARSQAASCSGGWRALVAHLGASVRGCFRLARF